jgi:hypothetical protein
MRWLLPLITIFACAHAPPPAPKPEVAVGSIADLEGKYTAGNEVDWGFFLTIDADGKLDLVIDRGKMGRCEQRGMLVAGADAKTFSITFDRNECDRAHAGEKLALTVESFTGDEILIAVKGDGVDERRRYQRSHVVSE